MKSHLVVYGFGLLIIVPLILVSSSLQAAPEKIMKKTPSRYAQVQQLLNKGRISEAEKTLQAMAENDARDWRARNLLGNLALAAGDLDRAYGWYMDALDIDPSQAEIYNNLGVLELKRKNGQAALKNFLMAVGLEPDNLEALKNISMIYQANGDTVQAAHYLQQTANAHPDDAATQLSLISTLLSLGKLKQAAIQCQILVDHHSDSANIRTDLGFLLLQHNIIDDAAGQFGKAIALDRNLSRAWYGLGLAARRLGQVETAIKALERAVTLQSDQPDYAADLALTWMSRKSPQAMAKSEKILQAALKKVPNQPRLLYTAGLLHDERNQSGLALRYYKKAYENGLRQPGFLVRYGALLMEKGKTKKAQKILKDVLNSADSSAQQRADARRLLKTAARG